MPRQTVHLCQKGTPLVCLSCGVKPEFRLAGQMQAVCWNRTDWETIYKNNNDYRRCTDPVDTRDKSKYKRFPEPKEPGYYWCQWRIVEPGTFPEYPQDEEKPVDNGRPRIVEVYMDIFGDLDVLVVDVMGVEKHQKLENFIWHSGKLSPPEES